MTYEEGDVKLVTRDGKDWILTKVRSENGENESCQAVRVDLFNIIEAATKILREKARAARENFENAPE